MPLVPTLLSIRSGIGAIGIGAGAIVEGHSGRGEKEIGGIFGKASGGVSGCFEATRVVEAAILSFNGGIGAGVSSLSVVAKEIGLKGVAGDTGISIGVAEGRGRGEGALGINSLASGAKAGSGVAAVDTEARVEV
jgi:hypothetical protein